MDAFTAYNTNVCVHKCSHNLSWDKSSFCANMFLSLREAASMRAKLPALEGWMLKRGNKMAKGSMNSWKLR